jgi:hypothetical protein
VVAAEPDDWRKPAEWFVGKTCWYDWFVPEEKDGKVVRVEVAYSDANKQERGEVWVTPEQIEAWPSAAILHGPVLVEWAIEGKIAAGKIAAGMNAAGMNAAGMNAAESDDSDVEGSSSAASGAGMNTAGMNAAGMNAAESDDSDVEGSSSAASGAGDSAGAGAGAGGAAAADASPTPPAGEAEDEDSDCNLGDLSLNLGPFGPRRKRR